MAKSQDTHQNSQQANGPKRTRIQAKNRQLIVDAALGVFSAYGFRGTTLDQIAEAAAMSKPNLLYYFRRKEDVYLAVLEHTLDDWLQPLRAIDADGEPIDEIKRYIERKLDLSRRAPEASRLYANEMLHGAPVLGETLAGPLRTLVNEKAAIIRKWVAEGRLAPIDPHHLIFAIWATTQHYADFDTQVRAVLGERTRGDGHFDDARTFLDALFLDGLRPR